MVDTIYSIEQHLLELSEKNDRIQSLFSIFKLKNEELKKYLSSIKSTYATYSTHDSYHSDNIIIAIEKILGNERIKMLSGADSFLILICAYMHDLGMIYTDKEVRKIWESDKFQVFLEECKNRTEPFRTASYLVSGDRDKEDFCAWPLDIKQAVGILLMEFFRSKHGKRIEIVTDKNYGTIGELLGIHSNNIPERIVKLINKISMAHNWSFDRILSDLTYADSLYGEDIHPRFVAILLRLGDLCDLDNNRFDKVSIAVFGNLGDDNLPHYFKHRSVNTLYISMNRIHIIANVEENEIIRECRDEWMQECEDDERRKRIENVFRSTVKEHILWKTWMESELKAIKQYVRRIFPEKIGQSVPELIYKILINGEESASSMKNMRFNFSQERAFSLIESISIYKDKKFIFVRELVQNAIDATKIQLWRDLNEKGIDNISEMTPFEIERNYPGIYNRYPITIHVNYDESRKLVKFEIEDCGIGISIDEFESNILNTGCSWGERVRYEEELKNMPRWLQPTGAFGIGLHTVFYKAEQLEIITKSVVEHWSNKINLYSGKKDGFAFCQKLKNKRKRGSTFKECVKKSL